MIACLTMKEIEKHRADIEREFEQLLNARQMEVKHGAKQWQFFRHCYRVLMGSAIGEFDCGKGSPADYWKMVSEKLARYYSDYYSKHHKEPIHFKFWLKSVKRKDRLFGSGATYACSNGYMLLVIPTNPNLNTLQQIRGAIAKALDNAIDAEYRTYKALPAADLSPLQNYFDPDGSAYGRIVEDIEEHRKRDEVLSNPENPSTRPYLRSVQLIDLDERTAKVSVDEYWNLHWLSDKRKVYVGTYIGQNHQEYDLIKVGDSWVVKENKFSRPRESPP